MKITYDRSADAVYISLTSINSREPLITYPCDPIEVGGQINLDFNSEGQLVGIEVLDARMKLPKDFILASYEID